LGSRLKPDSMNAPAIALPATLPEAHALIQQLFWRVRQLEKELFGPSSERQIPETLSKEQILLSLFPRATPAATQEVPRKVLSLALAGAAP